MGHKSNAFGAWNPGYPMVPGVPTALPEDAERPLEQPAASPPASRQISSDPQAASTARHSSRYLSVGELGRGGWGVVERAIDHQLDREVAIKRLSAAAGSQQAMHARFLHEARVTSQLQHPSIVPVHELGTNSTGEAYYVMKLLEGNSLLHHIRQAHQTLADQAPNSHQLRQVYLPLLERFIDVCHAIAYAHQRGIIHRDLKPANIMIGEFGETVVVDWGLAKQLTSTNQDSATEDPLEDQQRVMATAAKQNGCPNHSLAPYEKTLCGSVVGTPAYMPPEQAAGNLEQLGPRSDIYALGVMLFEIVCGDIPLAGQDLATMLAKIQRGELPRLREKQSAAPRALQAICAKAMALRVEERYESAEELADDVKRFIAGEAVSVYRERAWERASRWCRQHQALARVLLVSGLLLLISSVAFGLVIHQAHRAERQARHGAEAAHQDAIARLAQARDSADAWLVELSGLLDFYPGLQPMRDELVRRALRDYEQLANQDLQELVTHDPLTIAQFQFETARAKIRLADLLRQHPELGKDDPSAQTLYCQAAAALHDSLPLLDAYAMDSRYPDWIKHVKLELLNAHIGMLQLAQRGDDCKQPDDDSRWLELATWLQTQLPAGCLSSHHDSSPVVAESLDEWTPKLVATWAQLNYVHSQNLASDSNASLEALRRATSAARWLANERRSAADIRLAEKTVNDLANAMQQSNLMDEANITRQQLLTDLSRWTSAQSKRPDLLQSLAMAKLNYAQGLSVASQSTLAAHYYDEAIDDLNAAWQYVEADNHFGWNVAFANQKLARLLASFEGCNLAQHQQTIARLRSAIQVYEELLVHDAKPQGRRRLSESHAALAERLWLAGDENQLIHWEAARVGYQALIDQQFACPPDRIELVLADIGCSQSLIARQEFDRAEQVLQAAATSLSAATEQSLESLVSKARLRLSQVKEQLYQAQGREDQAEACDREAVQLMQKLAEQEYAAGDANAYPLAAQRWLDYLLRPTHGKLSSQQLTLAADWHSRMAQLYTHCQESADWWQRGAILAWQADHLVAAEDSIARCRSLRDGDLLDSVLLHLIRASGGVHLDEITWQELYTSCQQLPNHQRLQSWLIQLKLCRHP